MAISIYTGCVSKGSKRSKYQGFLFFIVVGSVIFLVAPGRSLYLRCNDPQIEHKFDLAAIVGCVVYALLIGILLLFVFFMAYWDYFGKVGSIILFFLLSPFFCLFYNFVFFPQKNELIAQICWYAVVTLILEILNLYLFKTTDGIVFVSIGVGILVYFISSLCLIICEGLFTPSNEDNPSTLPTSCVPPTLPSSSSAPPTLPSTSSARLTLRSTSSAPPPVERGAIYSELPRQRPKSFGDYYNTKKVEERTQEKLNKTR